MIHKNWQKQINLIKNFNNSDSSKISYSKFQENETNIQRENKVQRRKNLHSKKITREITVEKQTQFKTDPNTIESSQINRIDMEEKWIRQK